MYFLQERVMERMKSQVKTGFKRQFSLGKLTKRLSYSGRSYSESRINCEDSEHLLENCEPLDIKLSASEKTNKKMASTDIADVSSSKTTSNGTPPVFQVMIDSVMKPKSQRPRGKNQHPIFLLPMQLPQQNNIAFVN